jgi:hypothetical protein
MQSERFPFCFRIYQVFQNQLEDGQVAINLQPKTCKIDSCLYTLSSSKRSDISCSKLREQEYDQIIKNMGDIDKLRMKEYPYYSIVKYFRSTIGFKRSSFLSHFKDDLNYSFIKKILSEKEIKKYLGIEGIPNSDTIIRAILPKTGYEDIQKNKDNKNQESSNNSNNNNNTNTNANTNGNVEVEKQKKKKSQKIDYIIPIVFIPYILLSFPDHLKDLKINDMHEICIDIMTHLNYQGANSNKPIIRDYYNQFKLNWLKIVHQSELNANSLQNYMLTSFETEKKVNLLISKYIEIEKELKEMKRKQSNLNENESEHSDDNNDDENNNTNNNNKRIKKV